MLGELAEDPGRIRQESWRQRFRTAIQQWTDAALEVEKLEPAANQYKFHLAVRDVTDLVTSAAALYERAAVHEDVSTFSTANEALRKADDAEAKAAPLLPDALTF